VSRARFPQGSVVVIVWNGETTTYHALPVGVSDATLDWLRARLREQGCGMRVERLDIRGTVEVIVGDRIKAEQVR